MQKLSLPNNWHCLENSFIAKTQLSQKKHLHAKLAADEVILHEDFSENFALKQQNEIMSAHWVGSSVTLFTAIITTQSGSQSYEVVSDDLRHDKFAMAAFNRAILNHTAANNTCIDKIHFFSDGAGGQFKNCYSLSTIADPKLLHSSVKRADWSFFATAHGKGPVDGIGGTLKRTVWRRVLQKEAIVNSSKDFVAVASTACPKTVVLHVASAEVSTVREELSEIWKSEPPQTIPDTRSYHFFKPISPNELEAVVCGPFTPGLDVETKTVTLYKTKTEADSDDCYILEDDHDDDSSAPSDTEEGTSPGTEEEEEPEEEEPATGPSTPHGSSMSSFIAFLAQRHFKLHGETPGDGNCFFWAIKSQLEKAGLGRYGHDELRKMIFNYIELGLSSDE